MSERLRRNQAIGQMLVERRSGTDRRGEASFWAFLSSSQKRRKSRGRRKTDRASYVDIYDSRTWCIVVAILILSFMDALLTGLHVVRGSAMELNPILRAVLEYGGFPAFYSAKAAMTVFPVAVIMIHKEWTLAKYAVRLVLWAYILLSVYHMFLLFRVHSVL